MTAITNTNHNLDIVVSTHYGFESYLSNELTALGAQDINIHNRAVSCKGDMELVYTINYCSRLALKVLIKIASFEVPDANTMYEEIYDIEWDNYLLPNGTVAINSICNQSVFDNSMFASMRAKDAIADYFRHKTGIRPSVDNDKPDLRLQLHIFKEQGTLLLDSSGNSLHQRGYRQGVNKAPINEVLAAGLIQLTGWDASVPFIDPMCGSGTFLIEAAMLATNTPGGYFRKEFGFERWKGHDEELFKKVVAKANAKINKNITCLIKGSDNARKSLTITRDNIKDAGFTGIIKTSLSDFTLEKPDTTEGIVILNPPYGGRLDKDDIIPLYKTIGTTLKHTYGGHTAWLITANKEAAKNIGLHAAAKVIVYNGQLECRFLKFELYDGSRKHKIEKPERSL